MVRRASRYDDAARQEIETGIRILIADDHQMVRDGLCSMLASERDIEVVGGAEDGLEAVAMARRLVPDVVVMDIGMPGLNGFEATRQIRAENPAVKVVALSMYSDSRYVQKMLEAGALGFVVKAAAYDELHRAIQTVSESRTYLSPSITGVIIDGYDGYDAASPPVTTFAYQSLTPKERQIVQLLAEGASAEQIARRLNVSASTIETDRRSVMEKLGIQSIAELTKYAIREGLTSLY